MQTIHQASTISHPMNEQQMTDHRMMVRALELAKKGVYTTSPNPKVGCVIAREGKIIAEGWHQYAGQPHAEVHALASLAKTHQSAVGATAYVTLEPCCHYGKTPPCANALIDAGIARVVCAMQDPNPKVAGKGFERLRAAGIEVCVGVLEQDANALNRSFIFRMTQHRPWVQLKLAASLDGQIALANGNSQWITSPCARADVQKYRAQACAVLSTSQTVIADNASLNVRPSQLPESVQAHYLSTGFAADMSKGVRQPKRVILDRQGLLTRELKLFGSLGDLIVLTEQSHPNLVSEGRFDLQATLSYLALEHEINQLWVEAGAQLANSLMKDNLVDELILYLAPKFMGSDGRGLLGALGLTDMASCPELIIDEIRQVGPDVRLNARFRPLA